MVFHNGEPSIGDTIRVVKHPSRFEIATMPDRGVVVTQIRPKGKLDALLFVFVYIYMSIFRRKANRGKRRGEGRWEARRCIVWKHLIGQTG